MAVVVFVNMRTATVSTVTNSVEYVGSFNIIPSTSKNKHLTTNFLAKFMVLFEVILSLMVAGNVEICIDGRV